MEEVRLLMKLYYFKAEHGNFGDDLNPWLWGKLLPGFFDEDDREIFVGIGTLLNHRLPQEPVKHVFGSGYGYGQPPDVRERFVIHAVRGFETARVLGIDRSRVITDAAVLLRTVPFRRATSTEFRFGFIPHQQSSRYFGWETLCAELGYHYICAEWDVEKVLFELSRCDVVICEAMHGAIAADTLRIPWVPVTCYSYISEFKWRDWLSTLSLPYDPVRITSIYDIERSFSTADRFRNSLKRSLKSAGVWSSDWTLPPRKRSREEEIRRALTELQSAARVEPLLSSDSILEGHVERYEELVRRLRQPGRVDSNRIVFN